MVWNPEFLREGFAVADTAPTASSTACRMMPPARRSASRSPTSATPQCWSTASPGILTNHPTSELVKVAANSFSPRSALSTPWLSRATPPATSPSWPPRSVTTIARTPCAPGRLRGGCLPKDIRAFAARAGELVDEALYLPTRWTRLQPAAARQGRRTCVRPAGWAVRRTQGRRTRRRLQAQQRRPGLARPRRGRTHLGTGRPGDHRPGAGPALRAKRPNLNVVDMDEALRDADCAAAHRVAAVRRPRPGAHPRTGPHPDHHRRPQRAGRARPGTTRAGHSGASTPRRANHIGGLVSESLAPPHGRMTAGRPRTSGRLRCPAMAPEPGGPT